MKWDLVLAGLIFYSMIIVPFRIGFEAEATGAVFIFDVCIDIFFFCDICVNFNTGFYNGDQYICDRKRIAKKYLRGALTSSGVEVVYVRRADRMASRVRRVRIIWEHLDDRKFVVVVAQRKMDLVGVGLPVSLFVVVSGNADPGQLWACTSTPSGCVSVRKRLIADTTTADAGEVS